MQVGCTKQTKDANVQCSLLEVSLPRQCLVDSGVQTELHPPLTESVPTHNPKEFESSESEISEISAETAGVNLSMAASDDDSSV